MTDLVCALDPASRAQELKSRLDPIQVTLAADGAEIEEMVRRQKPHMVVAGTRVLYPRVEAWLRRYDDLVGRPELVLVHHGEDAVFQAAAIRAGCLAVLGADLPIGDLAETVGELFQRRVHRLRPTVGAPAREVRLRDFVCLSPRMRELVAIARRLAATDTTLLLLGETGTGKERLAQALHRDGGRSSGPFVDVNCGALPESLAESELFGHEKGSFTGASRAHRGYFEQADGGTLFLDEVGELASSLQVKLLRVLEERRVRRVGSERAAAVDFRLIAATNRDLEQQVAAGRFREDLLYRLAVVTLTMPPLRERREDIPTLLEIHLDAAARSINRTPPEVEPDALEALLRYRWPGNVRELINVAERAVLLAREPRIRLADLPPPISSSISAGRQARTPEAAPAPASWLGQSLQAAREQVVEEFERRYLSELLAQTAGRVGEAARRAGVNERSLYEMMRRHHLRKEDFRPRRRDSS